MNWPSAVAGGTRGLLEDGSEPGVEWGFHTNRQMLHVNVGVLCLVF